MLIALLHRRDSEINLLYQRDYAYANAIQTQDLYEQQVTTTVSNTIQTDMYETINQNLTNQSGASSFFHRTNETLPHLFFCDNDLCGLVMKRTKTKIFFKKWKHCIFVVKPTCLLLYQSVEDWRQNRAVYWSIDLRSYMVSSCEGI